MAYESYSMNEEQRSATYANIYLCAFVSVVMFAANFIDLGRIGAIFPAFLIGTWFITFAVWKRFDEHFMGLVKAGAISALATMGAWMVVSGIIGVFEFGHDIGTAAANQRGTSGILRIALPELWNSAFFLASSCAVAFHAGFLFNHFRGQP